MTVPTDPLTFTDGIGQVASGAQVNARFAPLYATLNGALDVDNMLQAVKEKLGLSDAVSPRRGEAIIAASQARTPGAYGPMATPDQVLNVVLPAGGVIAVLYQAMWRETVVGDARAAIFLNGNQLKVQQGGGAGPVTQAAVLGSVANQDQPLFTTPGGLMTASGNTASPADVTTGQAMGAFSPFMVYELNGVPVSTNSLPMAGGPCYIFAAAGTYVVSVQFKTTSGNVVVTNRRLHVWTMAF